MAEALSLILMSASAASLIAWLGFVLRAIGATKKSSADAGGGAIKTDDFRHSHETSPSSHDGQRTFNR